MVTLKLYPQSIESKIGFDSVRKMLSELCLSSLGKQRVESMQPSSQFARVEQCLRQVDEMTKILASDQDFPLGGIHDLTSQLKALRVPGSHLAEGELSQLRSSLSTLAAISAFFAAARNDEGSTPYPTLDSLASGIAAFPGIIQQIDSIIDKFGYVKDSASPALAKIRGQLASMQGAISNAMRRVIAQAAKEGIIDADTSPAIRDGRQVIPVSPMHKRKIPGIVHDESASGKTYYIEPAEVVEASNRMRELQIEERHELMRILVALADSLRPHLPEMLDAYQILADFDFIHAKACFAIDCDAHMPHISDKMELEIYGATHPVLRQALAKQDKRVVPLDISLSPDKRLLVISGPNAGGKSVTLKTVAIVQYMAQSGLLPPVHENSHMGIVHSLFIDIGDDQSIEDDLSTYSSHLRNMKYFLANGNDRTLILIDEFGSGTEPQIGGAIAQAVLAEFVALGIWGVVTTHFQNLKHFADETEGLVNGSMLYDRQLMQPLFRLSIGNPGSSFAIEIARKTGLPSSIIQEAERIVGSDYINLDRYLLDIARDKRYWENKRLSIKQKEKKIDALIEKYEGDAEQLRQQRREILQDARTQAQQILDNSNAAIERTIHDIKKAQADREKTLEARRKLSDQKKQLALDHEPEHPLLRGKRRKGAEQKGSAEKATQPTRPLAIGDKVLLDDSDTVGSILEIQGNNALVAFGMIKTTVKLTRLKRTMRNAPAAPKSASYLSAATNDASRQRQLQFKPEIDVRGMRTDEAVQAIMYFIDDATQFNSQRVRILHGTGTGALRQYIRNYLQTVPAVASYHDEDVRFGGAGITVVNLK